MFNPKVFLAELLGTFALTFVVVAAGIVSGAGGGPVGIALSSGLVLAVMVYSFGHISGGHVNPAVTFAMALNGTLKWAQAVVYWVAQFAGAILAALLLNYIVTSLGGALDGGASIGALTTPGSTAPDATKFYIMGMAFEAIFTFLLVFAYLKTQNLGKDGAGWAIGAVWSFAILAGAPFTGASLNPARTLAAAIFSTESVLGLTSPFLYVVYLVGPLLGATLAVLAHNFFNGIMDDDLDEEEVDEVEEEA
jgi:MIP family channel proteins